jgi:hypothetical protein
VTIRGGSGQGVSLSRLLVVVAQRRLRALLGAAPDVISHAPGGSALRGGLRWDEANGSEPDFVVLTEDGTLWLVDLGGGSDRTVAVHWASDASRRSGWDFALCTVSVRLALVAPVGTVFAALRRLPVVPAIR